MASSLGYLLLFDSKAGLAMAGGEQESELRFFASKIAPAEPAFCCDGAAEQPGLGFLGLWLFFFVFFFFPTELAVAAGLGLGFPFLPGSILCLGTELGFP
jgi:hypothetical protein